MDRRDVVVVGAGITGLSAAWELHRAGRDVVVIERAEEVGGVIRSQRVPRVGVIDLGPQTVRSKDPELFQHLEDIGIAEDRIVAGENGKARYIVWDGELVELPHSPGGLIASGILSSRAKLRLLAEPFKGTRQGEDESVRKFFKRRLGKEVAERLVDPFVSGVYAGDPRQLSMQAVFPELKSGVDESGSLVRWGFSQVRGGRKRSGPKRAAELFSFPEGLAHWPRAIARGLGEDRVWLGRKTLSVRRVGEVWEVCTEVGDEVHTIHANHVILTVPAPRVGKILKGARRSAKRALRDIHYAPVSTVHLAYRRESVTHPLEGFGYLCPSGADRKVLGVLWISSLFPARVEPDRILLTTFIGGARTPQRAYESEGNLIDIAYREHRRFLGASTPPAYAQVKLWKRGIPQYEFGHLERVAAADRLEEENPGLHLAGAYRWGVSVTDCWKGGRRVAEQVLQADASDAPGNPADAVETPEREGAGAL